LPPEPTSSGKTSGDVLKLFMMILSSSGISLAFLWYVAKNPCLFSRLIYFSYGMTASEEEYPSWQLTSQTCKALRQIIACRCLWTIGIYHSLAHFVPPGIQNASNIASAAGAIAAIAAGSANPVGFIVGSIIAGAVFAKWFTVST
jgi:hypothetical protein